MSQEKNWLKKVILFSEFIWLILAGVPEEFLKLQDYIQMNSNTENVLNHRKFVVSFLQTTSLKMNSKGITKFTFLGCRWSCVDDRKY